MTALVFMDTETTGLDLTDDIWEFAAIRREADGTHTVYHAFIEHEGYKCARLPEPFLSDHLRRFPKELDGAEAAIGETVMSRGKAVEFIADVLRGRPHVVGAVPNFDTERLSRMFSLYAMPREPWHYHLIDIENLAVGFLSGRDAGDDALLEPPWKSHDLSAALGVPDPIEVQHTAMGDVIWAMHMYDAVVNRATRFVIPPTAAEVLG